MSASHDSLLSLHSKFNRPNKKKLFLVQNSLQMRAGGHLVSVSHVNEVCMYICMYVCISHFCIEYLLYTLIITLPQGQVGVLS